MDPRLAAPEPSNPADAPSPQQRALARLAASRQRLQSTWLPEPSSARTARTAGRAAGSQRLSRVWRLWRRRLADVPVVGLALDAAESWWQNNPWRLAGQTVAGELDHALTPWIRRHPILTVALAAGAGYTLISTRAWAWPVVADQWRPLPRRVGRWLLHQISQAPLQSVMAGLVATAAVAGHRAGADEPDAPAPPVPPSAPADSPTYPPERGTP